MKKHHVRLELDKILSAAAAYASLDGGRQAVLALEPVSVLAEARRMLALTGEAVELLFRLGAGKIEVFPPLGDSLERAEKKATLSCKELTDVALLLRSARVCQKSVLSLSDENISGMKELAGRLVVNQRLEEEIGEKIIGENEVADRASEKLYTIRREIRLLNERIRARLAEYLVGEESKYLQDAVITMRGDRYVIPVKVEYKRNVKGFIHDRSQTGQTVFVEPEEVLEMNNELRSLIIDEQEEIERILSELSRAVGVMRGALERDMEVLFEIDSYYARAEYAYKLHCVKPELNARGAVEIVKGRHPLLDQKTAVPVSVSVGEDYSFLLISGANTGGKTVTLKMCGLFCLMAACGMFVPAAEGTRLSVFGSVFCDVGDSQSIEENLSTFSSHVLNLKEICEQADSRSFVLIDEPGGGTDPEEGQALARAVLVYLLKKGCRGIVTTHYSALKEFAFATEGMENGCMEFDGASLRPLYRLKIGFPGPSNALLICSRLGLPEEIIGEAREHLSDGARAFERTVRAAEESRVQSEALLAETEQLKREWQTRLSALEKEEAQLKKEREKLQLTSKAEARRIVNARTAEAEELIGQIEEIFRKETVTEADLIKARTLKNKIANAVPEEEEEKVRALPVDPAALKAGDRVFVKSMEAEGTVLSVKKEKGTAEIRCGSIQVRAKISELYIPARSREEKSDVKVTRDLKERAGFSAECNVIGMTVSEALAEVDAFLDGALLQNLSEVRIVHGMGTGALRKAIGDHLKKNKRVESFRLGKYGEGESGVTVVTLR